MNNIPNYTTVSADPTPNFITKAENKVSLESLKCGASTTVQWAGQTQDHSIKVTLNINGKLGFYEPDVLSALGITDDVWSEEDRNDFKEDFSDIAFDPSDPLLLFESGIYMYLFRSPTEKGRAFVRWVCSEVIPSVRIFGVYSDDSEDMFDSSSMSSILSEMRMHSELMLKRIESSAPNTHVDFEGIKQDLLTKVDAKLNDYVINNNIFEARIEALSGKLDSAVEVFHNSSLPLTDQGAASKSVVKTKRPEKPFTEDQLDLYKILHEQLSAATGGAKRIAGGMLLGRFSTKFWNVGNHPHKGSVLNRIGMIVNEGLESTGSIDEFLECCSEVVSFNGLQPVCLDLWERGLDLTKNSSTGEVAEFIESNNLGSNLKFVDVSEITLK